MYPTGNPEEFAETAQSNMEHYGVLPYAIGSLVIKQVVDQDTRRMAADIHSHYLDSGSSAKAFIVSAEGSDTEDVMTVSLLAPKRFSEDPLPVAHRPYDIDKRLEALRRAQGLKGHVQLKAADRENGIAITTKAPGSDVAYRDEVATPSGKDWKRLRKTLKGMRRRGIGFDTSGSNMHWDPEAGFTVYDTHPATLRPRTWVKPATVIAHTKHAISLGNRSHRSVDDHLWV